MRIRESEIRSITEDGCFARRAFDDACFRYLFWFRQEHARSNEIEGGPVGRRAESVVILDRTYKCGPTEANTSRRKDDLNPNGSVGGTAIDRGLLAFDQRTFDSIGGRVLLRCQDKEGNTMFATCEKSRGAMLATQGKSDEFQRELM